MLDTTLGYLNMGASLLNPQTAHSYGILCGLMDSLLGGAPHVMLFAHSCHMSGWPWWVGECKFPNHLLGSLFMVSPSSLEALRNRQACSIAHLPFFSCNSALVVVVCTTIPVPGSYLKVVDQLGTFQQCRVDFWPKVHFATGVDWQMLI